MPQIGYAHGRRRWHATRWSPPCHPLASLAGVEVLKSGGTVADAAVAANADARRHPAERLRPGRRLLLPLPRGGHGTRSLPERRRALGRRAPGSTSWLGAGYDAVPMVGPGAVSVPGVTRAWTMLLDRFGTRPLRKLLEPAVHYAREGFPITDIVCQAIRERAPSVVDPEWHRVFVPGGAVPQIGQCFRQPDLARTLADLGDDPDLFYRGRVARAIHERVGPEGFLTAADLAEHTGEWGEPISTTYRGYTVYETPPPTQGLAALLSLNLLEGFDLKARPVHSTDHLHLLIEMTKLAYADRDQRLADPAHASVPVEALLDKAYAERRRRAFTPDKAQTHRWGDVDGATTGFVVADGRGNVLSVIQSIYKSFGSTVVPPGTGVVLHNRGAYFSTDPKHPNHFAPRKRPFHTLIACVVTRDDRADRRLRDDGR